MNRAALACVALGTGLAFVACTTTPPPADATGIAVAPLRLAEVEMTPVELTLAQDIPAGTELRLRQSERLRPVWVGVYQVTNITAEGVAEPLALRDVPTFADIQGQWGRYEKSGLLAILKTPAALPAGTKLTVRGRKYDGVDPMRQRYTGRECRAWLEYADTNHAPAGPVTSPLIVRTAGGPVHRVEAYRKADGRLLVQAFDKEDNPTDDAGATYTITGEGCPQRLSVSASPGCGVTEIALPRPLQASPALQVQDGSGHGTRGTPLPRGLDGCPIFFGDIHCHTGFSDGDFPTEDTVAWARERIGLDFTGPGDHISQEGNFGDLTYRDYARFGRQYEQRGIFCRLPALETSCGGGHQLVLARDFGTFVTMMDGYVKTVGPTADMMDSAAFYTALIRVMPAGAAMVAPVHPIGSPGRWPDIADKSRVGATEVFHGGSSHESHVPDAAWLSNAGGLEESSIRHALATGYRLGFIGDSDNHRCLPGRTMVTYNGLTAVKTRRLDSAGVFDAIRDRRCYATSGARIVADATLNGAPIGSVLRLKPFQPRSFKISVRGTAPIAAVQIIHGRAPTSEVQVIDCEVERGAFDVVVERADVPAKGNAAPGPEYYYVRVRQADGHCAWLSPFWVEPAQ